MKNLLGVLLLCGIAWAQKLPEMPSTQEIGDLLNKADEKVTAYEAAIRNAKPYLDQIDQAVIGRDLDAASTAHTLIKQMNAHGPSAYQLVALVATLDDLSLNAATATTDLLRAEIKSTDHGAFDANAAGTTIVLSSSGAACNDISELLLHETLRYINVEETILNKALGASTTTSSPASPQN